MYLKKLKLFLIANLMAITTANAGLPVLEENSTVFMPLSYLEQLQTQLNTLAEYEQMILDYENQYRQLEYMVKNFDVDQYKFSNLTELRARLDMFKSQYLYLANQYNEFAQRTNRIQDDYCKYADKLELCQKKFDDLLEEIKKINEQEAEKQANERDSNKVGTIANLLTEDVKKFTDLVGQTNNRNPNKDGTNQILSDNRNQLQLLNQQLLNLRDLLNKQYYEKNDDRLEKKLSIEEHLEYIRDLQKRSLDYKRKTYKDNF